MCNRCEKDDSVESVTDNWDSEKDRIPYCHGGVLSENASFNNMREAKLAIKHFCTTKKSPVRVTNSRPTKFSMECWGKNCSFAISCFLQKLSGRVDITRFQENHDCLAPLEGRTVEVRGSSNFQHYCDNVNVKVSTIRAAVGREEGVVVPCITAWRAKQKAIKDFREDKKHGIWEDSPFLSRNVQGNAWNKDRLLSG